MLTPLRDGTRRVYTDRERFRLQLIGRGKRLGFTLDEIRETFDLYDFAAGGQARMEHLLKVIAQHRDILLRQQNDILQVLEDMNGVEQRIHKKLRAPKTS